MCDVRPCSVWSFFSRALIVAEIVTCGKSVEKSTRKIRTELDEIDALLLSAITTTTTEITATITKWPPPPNPPLPLPPPPKPPNQNQNPHMPVRTPPMKHPSSLDTPSEFVRAMNAKQIVRRPRIRTLESQPCINESNLQKGVCVCVCVCVEGVGQARKHWRCESHL